MSKRYYWLKLKENFFKETKVALLFREPRGKEILLVYIYLLLESIKGDGILRYNEERGYTELELSRLSGFSLPLMKTALKSLIECGFVSREEDGTLVMNEFQGMVGSEAESTSRSRKSRCNATKMQQKCNIEKEIDKEIEIESEQEKDILSGVAATYQQVDLTDEQMEILKQTMGEGRTVLYIEKLNQFILRNKAKVKDPYQTILKWYREDCC